MKHYDIIQCTPEWWALKCGKISGTRFGQVISGRKNGLVYELLNERLDGAIFPDDFVTEDMQFGIDNEPIACDLYSKQSGIEFVTIGAITSDASKIHMASPDRISKDEKIILEAKCTQHGQKQIERFFTGPDSTYMPQIKNYFAVDPGVEQVHWISYCPSRPERPLVVCIFDRNTVVDVIKATKINPERTITVQDKVLEGCARIKTIEAELLDMEQKFVF